MAWELWENVIIHIDRSDESNGIADRFTELFEPEGHLERLQCIGMEQNKQVESQVRIVANVRTGNREKCLQAVSFFCQCLKRPCGESTRE